MPGTRPLYSDTDLPSVRVHAENWNDIYVVGDVHGCRETLVELLDSIAPAGENLVVLVGDLVRKGPDSKGVIDIVRNRENVLSIRGNNEQKLIDGRKRLPSLSSEDVSFLESLPLAIGWENSLVVHGGIDPQKPVAKHSRGELLTMRSLVSGGGYDRPYWFETRRENPRVFFGHTVLSDPFETDWAVGLDTGCVHGGQLTAYRCSTGAFISVEPPTTHVNRSPDSIVNPRVCDPVP
ncbi:MAG: metallophosphoesterase family protein [Halobacteriales archaeon]